MCALRHSGRVVVQPTHFGSRHAHFPTRASAVMIPFTCPAKPHTPLIRSSLSYTRLSTSCSHLAISTHAASVYAQFAWFFIPFPAPSAARYLGHCLPAACSSCTRTQPRSFGGAPLRCPFADSLMLSRLRSRLTVVSQQSQNFSSQWRSCLPHQCRTPHTGFGLTLTSSSMRKVLNGFRLMRF